MPRNEPWADDIVARVVEMWKEGYKQPAITRETGVPKASVYNVVRRFQLDLRQKPRGHETVATLTEALRKAEARIRRLEDDLRRKDAILLRLLEGQGPSAPDGRPPARPRTTR